MMAIQPALITQNNVDAVAKIVKRQQGHRIVVERHENNVEIPGSPSTVTKENLWHAHMLCLLTSQQPSGEGDPVWILLNKDPFPLSYKQCQQADDTGKFVRDILHQYPGIRFRDNRIPNMAATNFERLEAGEWKEIKQHGEWLRKRRRIPDNWNNYAPLHKTEEEACEYMDGYEGFGPKQSRNFWQALGLTRYVSVLDSRVKKWCEQGLHGDWSAFNIGRKKDYVDMADTIRELCRKANVLPCMFDAAVFSTFEKDPRSASWCRW